MKTQVDEVVLGGGIPFTVRVGTPVFMVAKGARVLTRVTRLLGGDHHGRFVEVAHEGMRFNCKDSQRRGYPLGCAHLERFEMPLVEGIPTPSDTGRPEGAIVRPLGGLGGGTAQGHRVASKIKIIPTPQDSAALERARLEARLVSVRWDKVAADPGLAQVILDIVQAGLAGDHVSRRGDTWKFTVEVEHADPGR